MRSCQFSRSTGRRASAPWQAPQSAHAKDDGEEREHANRQQRPDEEEMSLVASETARNPDALRPTHVYIGHKQPEERPEQDDDVSRSPPGEQQCAVQPDAGNEHRPNEVREPSWLPSIDDVTCHVKR